jgi:hypothetical protein
MGSAAVWAIGRPIGFSPKTAHPQQFGPIMVMDRVLNYLNIYEIVSEAADFEESLVSPTFAVKIL